MRGSLKTTIFALCIVGLFIGVSIVPAFSTKLDINNHIFNIQNRPVFESPFSSETRSYHDMYLISADSHFKYGLECGIKFNNLYKALCGLIWIIVNIYSNFPSQFSIIKHVNETSCPEYLEELKGLSIGTNIPMVQLLTTHIFLLNFFNQQCTITLSTGDATEGNQTYLTQNWDLDTLHPYFYLFRIIFSKTLFISNIEAHYSYVFLGIPILYEHPLLNEMGLGWGGTGTYLTDNNSRIIDEGNGVPPYVLVRKSMMNCCNVSEVANLWMDNKRSSNSFRIFHNDWDYDSYAWCDNEDGILVIEQTHTYIQTIFDNPVDDGLDRILWHTNHHIYLDPYQTGSVIPGENYKSNSSLLRLNRAYELLVVHYGNISLETCKQLTRDHEKGMINQYPDSSDICCHSDNYDSYETAIAWIIHPQSLTIYMTHTKPCEGHFKEYDCTMLFSALT